MKKNIHRGRGTTISFFIKRPANFSSLGSAVSARQPIAGFIISTGSIARSDNAGVDIVADFVLESVDGLGKTATKIVEPFQELYLSIFPIAGKISPSTMEGVVGKSKAV